MEGSLRAKNSKEGSCFTIRVSLKSLEKKENETI